MSTPEVQTQTPEGGNKLPKLPSVGYFLIDDFKYKYSLPGVHAIDCVRYLSRSKLSFNGCYKVEAEGDVVMMEELPGGLYGSFLEPKITLRGRAKLTRNKDEIPKIIENLLRYIGPSKEKKTFLVQYDNFFINIYDKYVRAVDVQLQPQNLILTMKHSSYEIKLYKLDYAISIDDLEKYLTNTIEHPVQITTDKKALIELWTPWRQFYEAVLLINNDTLRLTIEDEAGVLTSPGLYLILIH